MIFNFSYKAYHTYHKIQQKYVPTGITLNKVGRTAASRYRFSRKRLPARYTPLGKQFHSPPLYYDRFSHYQALKSRESSVAAADSSRRDGAHEDTAVVPSCVQLTACLYPRGKFVEGVEVYPRKRLHSARGVRSDDPRKRAPL